MTGRDRVLAALARKPADRTPFAWGFGPTGPMTRVLDAWCRDRGVDWAKLRARTGDTIVLEPDYAGPALPPGQPLYTAVWGIGTLDVSYGAGSYKEFVGHPLAGMQSEAELSRVRWPSADWFDYGSLRRRLRQADPDGTKARQLSVGSTGNPFEIYTWMTGMEEAMTNLIVAPDLVRAALSRICNYFEAKLERSAEALAGEIDLVHAADDLGGQQGLIMSRETYRDVIQPFHRRLIAHAKRLLPLAKVMYHSDGSVFDILPDLIDAGIDVLEAVQTETAGMEPERLKAAYGEQIGFHGGISVQALLPRCDADTVRAECRRLAAVFGNGGGYIAAPSHAIQAGTPPENVWAMLEGILGEDELTNTR